ncbi:MAG: ABC-ATPase domain-containing protein [Anaerobutyricum soehngenii]
MKNKEDLKKELIKIDHKSYGMYKTLGGSYSYGNYILHIDHVQGDPFASPSRLRFEVKKETHGFPEEYYEEKHRRLALEDQVLRRFLRQLRQLDKGSMGSGKSGRITTCPANQTVQERIAVVFSKDRMELRFEMGFPARGRTIMAKEMQKLVFDILPELAESCLFYRKWDTKSKSFLEKTVFLADDQKELRWQLKERGLTGFVANGAMLPRESGISDRPMRDAVPFISPESLQIEIELPHKGKMIGMGIPKGITVIVGGGYHGKSTLLKALEQGVYNHIAGDGREYVVADATGMKIRAEDGRSILHTDISLFINHLPAGQDTVDFSSENASGSTSQAANLIEAMEAGAELLLLDEDTSATNFMIRDKVMAKLVSDEKEPITTLLRHIRGIYKTMGISFIIVVGSSGDYLSVADLVLQLDHYKVKDVTKEAKEICEQCKIAGQYAEKEVCMPEFSRKLKPVKHARRKLKSMGTDTVLIDRESIDVRYLEQLSESGQTTALAYMMGWILDHVTKEEDIQEFIENMYKLIERKGMAAVIPANYSAGHPVLPRKQELYACLNRYRSAKIVKEYM